MIPNNHKRKPKNNQKPPLQMAVKPKAKTVSNRTTYIVLAVFIILAITTGVVLFSIARDIFKTWTATPLDGIPVDSEKSTAEALGTALPMDTILQPQGGPTAEPWDGKSRVTILLMGLDYREWEAGEVPRADTLILFTLDPVTQSAGMLSVPRDMWVNIPGYDYAKINQAYYFGELYKLPGGGPALAMETLEQFIGVPIDYYAQVDFSAFVRFIDEIKGVKIFVEEPITIVLAGSNKKETLQPGWVTLPGEYALAYARNRYVGDGDFDRARRQQQVILAVRDRILSFNMLPTLITRAPVLYNELSSSVRTNLSLEQVIRLAVYVQQIPRENIKSAVIGTDMIEFGTSADGLDILIPIPDKIRLLRDEIFAGGGAVAAAAVTDDPNALMVEEAARVSVQNGTGQEGLAANTGEWLREKGINVVDESNAGELYSTTTFFIYSGKPYTLNYLLELMQLENARIYNRYDPDAAYDIVITLGQDWVNDNPMP